MVRLGKVKNLPHVIRCISFTQFKLSTILHHIFFSHFINNYLIPPAVYLKTQCVGSVTKYTTLHGMEIISSLNYPNCLASENYDNYLYRLR